MIVARKEGLLSTVTVRALLARFLSQAGTGKLQRQMSDVVSHMEDLAALQAAADASAQTAAGQRAEVLQVRWK